MRALPLSIGTIHFVGIGGIGMSGIAEVLHNARLFRAGQRHCRLRQRAAAARRGHSRRDRPRRRQSRRRAGRRRLDRGEARQPGGRRRARPADPGGAPRRNAGRADAAEMVDRGRRHAWQDHHHQPGRRGAGGGAARSHRDQRRHHQRLRHQHAAGRRRLDGGRGRRKRRQLPAPARDHRRRHQHGPGASGPLGHAGGDDRRLRPVRRQHSVLWLRGAVHRPSGGAADDPAPVGPSHHHLRLLAAGRCARGAGDRRTSWAPPSRSSSPTAPATGSAAWVRSACRCWAATTCRTRWRRSPSASKWRSTTPRCAARSSASRASSAASPRPARPAASPSSTITATIRWRSPRC